MKVKDLARLLDNVDPELDVKLNVVIEKGFYDVPGKSAGATAQGVRFEIREVVIYG